jgi:hypothetical protein
MADHAHVKLKWRRESQHVVTATTEISVSLLPDFFHLLLAELSRIWTIQFNDNIEMDFIIFIAISKLSLTHLTKGIFLN